MQVMTSRIVALSILIIEQGLEQFLLRCRAKDLSGETLLWYKERLIKFNVFLASKGVTRLLTTGRI